MPTLSQIEISADKFYGARSHPHAMLAGCKWDQLRILGTWGLRQARQGRIVPGYAN